MKTYKKITTKQTIARLGWVREAMVKAKKLECTLDMRTENTFDHNCNTSACVFGWAALSPKFKRIGVLSSSSTGIYSHGRSEAEARKIWNYASMGVRLIGLTDSETEALGDTNASNRIASAEDAYLPLNINHFVTDNPTYDDVIEVIDLLIERYKGQLL
tara:strand:+ start:182019 stop:182495 length:477 start_codon:yes stop_codon:yes gene_type:complete